MKTVIFDGRAFAAEKEAELKKSLAKLKSKGITPKLVSVLVGDDPASILYVNLKKKAGERIGCVVEVVRFNRKTSKEEIIKEIIKYNTEISVHGIMLQLPLPEKFTLSDRDEIINSISPRKDVDGLMDSSLFLTPTVKSVLYVLQEASQYIVRLPLKARPFKVIVVGYSGFEGGKIYKVLKEVGYDITGVDSKTEDLKKKTQNADILISATGCPGLIKENMIKEGAVVIDVGAPKGDVAKDEIIGKAGFLSPVPGGVGPVTILSLFENIVNKIN